MSMNKNEVNFSFVEYMTSQSHVNLENLTIRVRLFFKILGHNPLLVELDELN